DRRAEHAGAPVAAAGEGRHPARFPTPLAGPAGVGGAYGLWRRARAWAGGQRFTPGHGDAPDQKGIPR
ncbi:acyltransferase, partial [Azospirillum brasilense]|nr:acyltransferase [Azospirillum brasilense]